MKKTLNILLLQFFVFQLLAQVTGIVLDETVQPMIGVSVVLEGSSVGTVTDVDGHFSIEVPDGKTLTFSYLGYVVQKVVVSGQKELKISLQPDALVIEELVVMGYSKKSKTEISSAVVVLNEDALNDVVSNDVASLLQGKVSGVQVLQSSGEPGSKAEIRIRGISSIKPGSGGPLYVVDGIIGGSFDPNDVANITVLKDAGATGMYGARANKGVIIVTTKKAKSEKVTIELKTSYGLNIADHGNIKMMSGNEFYNVFSAEQYRDENTHEIDKIKFFQDYPQALQEKNFNWVDKTFAPAPIQKYYLSASGRSGKFGYYLSGTYYKEKGTFRKTGFDRVNLRANTDLQLSKRVNIKNNINISSSKGTTYDYLDMYYTYLGVPWDSPLEDGKPVYVDGNTVDWWSRDHINPFHSIDNSDYNFKGIDFNYDLVIGLRITDGLKFTSANRLNFATDKEHRFVSRKAAGTFHDKGFISEAQNMYYGGISTNLFQLEHKIGRNSFDGLIGGELQKSFYEGLNLEGKGLLEGFDVPTVASSEYLIGGSNDKEIFRSFISQVNYNFDRTYFLTASYRIDASSNFPANNRIAHFPSLSASWMLNRMPFLNASNLISQLKVRTSFGLTGDPDIGASRFLGLYALNTQYNNNSAATPFQLANPDLTWEKTKQLNFGMDAGLWKDRIVINLDLYKNVTTDLLVLASQPLSQGFEYRWENSGILTNSGFEIALSTVNIKKKKLSWTTDFNFAKNKNELSDIEIPFYTTINGISQIYRNGAEIYTFVLPKWLGVDPDTGGPLWEKIEKDDNGNIISREPTSDYSEAEPQEVGSALPNFSGGMSTTITYKGLSLFGNMAFQYGNEIYNFTRVFMDNDGHEPYYNNMVANPIWSRWERPGDNATHPSFQNNALSKEPSSRFLEDGSFLKIRVLNLSYSLPNSWVKNWKLNDITIGISANNIKTFTKFWGQDPEVTLTRANFTMPGVSDFKYPNNRRFLFNLNLKF